MKSIVFFGIIMIYIGWRLPIMIKDKATKDAKTKGLIHFFVAVSDNLGDIIYFFFATHSSKWV